MSLGRAAGHADAPPAPDPSPKPSPRPNQAQDPFGAQSRPSLSADSIVETEPAQAGEPIPASGRLRALVIGYGSPIRGDDALGPLVADQLQERLNALPQAQAPVRAPAMQAVPVAGAVEVQARHILTAELVDDLARAERVIFIDAAIDTPAGQVRRRRLSPDRGALSTMAHFHDPRELLAWCEALYGRTPEAWLVSGGGAEWGYACYTLSETAQQVLEPMIAEVLSLISASGVSRDAD